VSKLTECGCRLTFLSILKMERFKKNGKTHLYHGWDSGFSTRGTISTAEEMIATWKWSGLFGYRR